MKDTRYESQKNEESELECTRCGAKPAFQMGERTFCMNCYSIYGSCCLEFGADDVWVEAEEEEKLRKEQEAERAREQEKRRAA